MKGGRWSGRSGAWWGCTWWLLVMMAANDVVDAGLDLKLVADVAGLDNGEAPGYAALLATSP